MAARLEGGRYLVRGAVPVRYLAALTVNSSGWEAISPSEAGWLAGPLNSRQWPMPSKRVSGIRCAICHT